MNLNIVFPLPFDAWQEYGPYVKRFCRTFKESPPGIRNYVVHAVSNFGSTTDEVKSWFYGIKTHWWDYYGHGCDIGSLQFVSSALPCDDLIVGMTSCCYFHREGWGKRYVEAYNHHGTALYGAFTSSQTGRPHICTRGYMSRVGTLSQYPHSIDLREKGPSFEVLDTSISDWFRNQGLPLVQVLWDNEQYEPGWFNWEGRFRNGNQQACIIWDKHTDQYRDAPPEEKARLERMSEGKEG